MVPSVDVTVAGQLAVAESYGVKIDSRDMGDRTQLCYDGDAFMRVIAAPAAATDMALAALALTRPGCGDIGLGPTERRAWNDARLRLLAAVDLRVAPWLAHRRR